MNPLIWSLLLTSLTTSTILTMASNHWLLAWISLELNTLSIMPVMMKPHHPRAAEATTKYFIIQATAAATILLASTLNAWQTGEWSILHTNSTLTTTLATIAIMMKLGLAPTHLWYPDVMQGTTLYTAMLISTWQKIAPLALLYLMYNNLNPTVLMLLGLMSTATGGWTGLNQTQTRKVMAFSSIAHMGWLLPALAVSQHLATLTMIIYLTTTTAIFLTLATTATKTIQDLSTTWATSPPAMTTTMVLLMSLAGLPPLTGFMPKWLITNELTSTSLLPLGLALLLTSLPSLYFYTRMAYMTMLTSPPTTTTTKMKWRLNTKFNPTTPLLATLATTLLPLTTTLYTTT
uniref:NADH dehydrogenase subunit 2 n=1 Tax=Hemidactylus mandebensis TaxID=1643449 RepID=UPI0021B65936|nr:NADH dehydrogenase subunit 2 [Hemidactylus mandebensis]UVW80913.1 NADH dehydrogenase subunit 2 [Hemidactylus mandebensis]